MIKKIADEKYNDTFWKEFGTNIKLGVIEDHSNRTRLAKLLRFQSSHHASDITSLDQYVERMKEKQDKIYFMAGSSRKEVSELQLSGTLVWSQLLRKNNLIVTVHWSRYEACSVADRKVIYIRRTSYFSTCKMGLF